MRGRESVEEERNRQGGCIEGKERKCEGITWNLINVMVGR